MDTIVIKHNTLHTLADICILTLVQLHSLQKLEFLTRNIYKHSDIYLIYCSNIFSILQVFKLYFNIIHHAVRWACHMQVSGFVKSTIKNLKDLKKW